jgi:hypothetical protein
MIFDLSLQIKFQNSISKIIQNLDSNLFDLNIWTKALILIYEKVQTLVWISKIIW